MVEYLPRMLVALGSSPAPQKKGRRRDKIQQTKTSVSHMSINGKKKKKKTIKIFAHMLRSESDLVWNSPLISFSVPFLLFKIEPSRWFFCIIFFSNYE